MKILIHPFEQVTGRVGWDGEDVDYVWGAEAVAMGKHWDEWDESPSWDMQLDRLEGRLVKIAEKRLGHDVRLAPEYI